MTRNLTRLVPMALCALALAACADHATKPQPTTTRTTTVTTTESAKPRTATTSVTGVPASKARSGATAVPASSGPLPSSTGIAACDEYLASYKSCHLVAGIFPRDQIDSRYDMMRTSLLRQSQDPDMRDQLPNRCASLASQLKDALHGKSCADTPPPASTR